MNGEPLGLPDPPTDVPYPLAAPADDYIAPIAAIRQIELDAGSAAIAGLPAAPWHLTRIAPRSQTHAQVRYRHPGGLEVVGQWFADPSTYARALHATRQTASPPAQVVPLPQTRMFWQLGGADRKLPGVAQLCRIGATLVVHHPERRAVLRLATAAHYVKVLPPPQAAALADRLQSVRAALGDGGPRIPDLIHLDPTAGLVMMSALPGRSLLAWLSGETCAPPQLATLGCQAGEAVARLHSGSLPSPTHHDAAALVTGLERGLQKTGWIAPELSGYLAQWLPDIQTALLHTPAGPSVPLHRDCYDKQFIAADGAMGLLDFDTLSAGEAELDVANFLVHCDLRAWQGRCAPQRAATLATAFVQGYLQGDAPRPLSPDRLQAYADATRLRLACVYGCRPPQRAIVMRLVQSIGAPLEWGVGPEKK